MPKFLFMDGETAETPLRDGQLDVANGQVYDLGLMVIDENGKVYDQILYHQARSMRRLSESPDCPQG